MSLVIATESSSKAHGGGIGSALFVIAASLLKTAWPDAPVPLPAVEDLSGALTLAGSAIVAYGVGFVVTWFKKKNQPKPTV